MDDLPVYRVKAKQYLKPYRLKAWNIDPEQEYEIEWLKPEQLVNAKRLDLACKIFYIECRENGYDMTFAKKLYKKHIQAFTNGSFTEPGSSEKNSIGAYYEIFDGLIDDIKKNGFDITKSIIPVNENGVIMDGSHRAAVAFYYKIPVPIIRIKGIEWNNDYSFFKNQGLSEKYLDFMTYKYIHYSNLPFVICLWPRANSPEKRQRADELIAKSGNIVYRKDNYFNYHGLEQLMIHLYREQPWCGGPETFFSGIDGKASECYRKGSSTRVYVIDNITLDEVLALKKQIRSLFNIENHSIHITDTKEEAILAGQVLFNKNSIEMLNYGNPYSNKYFWNQLFDFIKGYNEKKILAPETTFALYGEKKEFRINYWNDSAINKRAEDPDFYLYYLGIKFPSFALLKENIDNREYLNRISRIKRKATKSDKYGHEQRIIKKPTRIRIKDAIIGSYAGKKLVARYRHKKYVFKGEEEKSINDLKYIFENLNDTCSYLIMRNWEGFYDDILIEGHNDIDILCGETFSRDMIVNALGAKKITDDGFHYSFQYKGKEVILDTRIVGDGYYDRKWQLQMLRRRKRHPLGFFIMDNDNYFYSLAYHAIYQKREGMSQEYLERLHNINPEYIDMDQKEIGLQLHNYMKENKYRYTRTLDRSVISVFDRIPGKIIAKYPLEIRLKHIINDFQDNNYCTRLKIKIRKLVMR